MGGVVCVCLCVWCERDREGETEIYAGGREGMSLHLRVVCAYPWCLCTCAFAPACKPIRFLSQYACMYLCSLRVLLHEPLCQGMPMVAAIHTEVFRMLSKENQNKCKTAAQVVSDHHDLVDVCAPQGCKHARTNALPSC